MKTKFTFKWLLLSIVLSIAGISQVSADITWFTGWANKTIYFDNSYWIANDYTPCLLIGRTCKYGSDAIGSSVNEMTKIDHTHLWYLDNFFYYWFTDEYFISNSSVWPNEYDCNDCGCAKAPERRYTSASHYTNSYNTNGEAQYNLFVPASKSNGASLTYTYNSDFSTLLNFTQTIQSFVKIGSGLYTQSNSPAPITTSSYYLDTKTSAVASTNPTLTTSLDEVTFTAAQAAITTLTVGEVAEGYEFVGWYDDSGKELSTSTSYEYYPNGAMIVRARFAATYTVDIQAGVCGTVTVTGGTTGNNTVGQKGVEITASSPYNGFYFAGWIVTGGAHVASETEATTTVTATGEGTVRANFKSDWYLCGTMSPSTWETEWEDGAFTFVSENNVRLDIAFAASSSYSFKLYKHNADNHFVSNKTKAGNLTDSKSGIEMYYTDPNIMYMTTRSGVGTYRFDYNIADLADGKPLLSITYPSSTTYTVTFNSYCKNNASAGEGTTTLSAKVLKHSLTTGNAVCAGENVVFNQTPTDGYTFLGWYSDTDGAVEHLLSTDDSYTISSISAASSVYALYNENKYDITLASEGPGHITISSVTQTSTQAGVTTTPTITAVCDNSTYYSFYEWKCTGGASVDDASSATTTVSATGEGMVTARFISLWAINGGDSYSPDGTDKMGDFSRFHGLSYDEKEGKYIGSIKDLDAHTTYTFKVVNRSTNAYYGYGEADNYDLAFIGKKDLTAGLYNNSGNDHNVLLMTAGSGEYTFEWDDSSTPKTLKVTFPNVTHPTADYVYFDDDANWNGTQSGVIVHLTGGIGTGSESMPLAGSCTISGKTYYYTSYGNNTTVKFSANNDHSKTTGNLTISTNEGKYYDQGTSAWVSFTFGVTLNTNDGTINDGDVDSYTFGTGATLPTDVTKTGYTFAGWYAASDFSGDRVYKITTTDNGAKTYWAKWEPNTLTFAATSGSNWNTLANWTDESEDNLIPTINHPVVISAPVTVDINNAVAKSITFSGSGTLTIPTDGALEVKEGIDNDDPDKLVIETDDEHQGALIFSSDGTTQAKVYMYSKVANPTFQFIAIPLTYVSINPTFAGTGIYTYVWHEGTGWERRGYYEDLSAFEAVGLTQERARDYIFTGNLARTDDFSASFTCTGEVANKSGVNMFGNSWTAPISIPALNEDGVITGTGAIKSIYIYNGSSWVAHPTSDSKGEVIPAMQAYVILSSSTSGSLNISYDAAVRTVAAGKRTEPLRVQERETSEGMIKTRIHVTDNERQTDLRLAEGAQFTEEFDNGWEAVYLAGDGRSGQLYAQKDDKMIVLADPSLEGTVVGFIPGEAENYTISFSGDETDYYLNDVKLGKSTLIAEGNTYQFTSDENTNATRFVISKIPMQPTGIEDVVDGVKARKQMIDGTLYIIRDGRIYTATGNAVK